MFELGTGGKSPEGLVRLNITQGRENTNNIYFSYNRKFDIRRIFFYGDEINLIQNYLRNGHPIKKLEDYFDREVIGKTINKKYFKIPLEEMDFSRKKLSIISDALFDFQANIQDRRSKLERIKSDISKRNSLGGLPRYFRDLVITRHLYKYNYAISQTPISSENISTQTFSQLETFRTETSLIKNY